MEPAQSYGALEQYDLLPPSYREQNRARQLFYSWTTVVGALMAILIGVSLATWNQVNHRRQRNRRIASAAIPLLQLRSDVNAMQKHNQQLSSWCDAVESAKPDDDLLQTLAAIASASQPLAEPIVIDSIQLRLATESPPTEDEVPQWARPLLRITTRHRDRQSLDHWLEQLNQKDRIRSASIDLESRKSLQPSRVSFGNDFSVTVTANPISTHVLP